MRVLIAPDSFKGTLTALEAAEAMARGVRASRPDAEVRLLPIADGGEGMVDVILRASSGDRRSVRVTGPLGTTVEAAFALIDDGATAIVESAAAIGLTLVPEHLRDPLQTTSYGLGELLTHASQTGATRIVVGLGGSSTNDGGIGMAQALGAVLDDCHLPACGGDLASLSRVDVSAITLAGTVEIIAACDVDNPLLGHGGATRTYGAQKGANPSALEQLEAGLKHLADLMPDVNPAQRHMGAAGGLGFGLAAFCNARLVSGAELVLDLLEVDRILHDVDLVVTGEGRLDRQSLHGKACIALAKRARALGVPVTAIAGTLGQGMEDLRATGIEALFAVVEDAADRLPSPDDAARQLTSKTARAIQTDWPHR